MSLFAEKLFPVINDLLTRSLKNHRKKILLSAKGDILEIGFGSGLSLEAYPEAVSSVIALEPSKAMIKRAQSRLKQASGLNVNIVEGFAHQMPFEDNSFDGVVSFLTLCTVVNIDGVISELQRVLRPGGKLFFIEHIAQPAGSLTRKIQDGMNPLWCKFACGCQTNRETLRLLELAGFKIIDQKTVGYSGFPNFLSPLVRGIAHC